MAEEQQKILVVDDERLNINVLVDLLKPNYKMMAAKNGEQALKAVRTANPPDLILLDIMMPDMDGYEVCKALKADAGLADVPVVFLSALGQTADKIKAFAVGGVDYITKPFQVEEVLARVETHLALRNAQRHLEEQKVQLEQVNVELVREIAARAQDSLYQYTVELEMRNEELDAFAHTVAHDLKSPVSAIIGCADLLKMDFATMPHEKMCKCLHVIAQGGRKIASITDELLLLARVRVQEMEVTRLNMASLVANVQHRLFAMIDEYRPEIILPESWPVVMGYGPWVEEAWVNYFDNAPKYGGRPPRVELGATPQADGTVRFWMCDNGPGLTPDEQTHLFTPFTRLEPVDIKGHGLGLSIVRRIVKKLGGQVGVESKVGIGSTFWFALPTP